MARRTSDDLKEVIRDFRRDQVIDVARRLFGERGTAEVPMDEIAAKAGVARSTVYVYFASRDELLRACINRMYTQLRESIALRWEEDAAPIQRLQTLVAGMFEQIDESSAFFRLALTLQDTGSRSSAAVGAELAVIGLDVAGLIGDLYADGRDSGLFRNLETDRVISFVGQQIYGAMAVRAGEVDPLPRDVAAAELCDFLVGGLGAR